MARGALVPLAVGLMEGVVLAEYRWCHACPACETHDGRTESWKLESAALFDEKLLHQFQTDAPLGDYPLPRGAPSAHVGQADHCFISQFSHTVPRQVPRQKGIAREG